MPVALAVRGRVRLPRATERLLTQRARRLLALFKWSGAELSLVVTDDHEMRQLNRKWRGLDRTTDVLSFPMDHGPPMLGDIVISLETAGRQARQSLQKELLFLLVHGFLHLAGYDHKRPKERAQMRRLERRLFKQSVGNR